MPTKLNKAQRQQPYVPAGHGDESGEYRDNFYGGNKPEEYSEKPNQPINIKPVAEKPTEKKPEDIGVQVEANDNPPEKPNQSSGQGVKKLQNALTNNLIGHQTSNRLSPNQKQVLTTLEGADDNISEVVANYIDKNNPTIKIGKNLSSQYCYSTYFGTKTLQLGSSALGEHSIYAKGSTFFHEFGHAIDRTYENNEYWSSNYVSSKYGKTLQQMVNEELEANSFDVYKEMVDSEFKALETKYPKDENYTNILNESNQYIADLIKNHPNRAKRKEITDRLVRGEIKYSEYWDEIQKYPLPKLDEATREYGNQHPEYQEAVKWYMDRQAKIKEEKEIISRKYTDLSDMVEAVYYRDLGCGGHGRSYWNKGSYKQGTEAFAEINSASAITDRSSIELLKRFIPKTIEIYNEIMGKIGGSK